VTDWIERGEPIPVETVLREWVDREARKDAYPDADPAGWDRERLLQDLTETYEEPAEPVVDGLEWYVVELDGDEVGELGTFPGSGWEWLSEDGTVAGAVERLDDQSIAAAAPDAAEKVAWFAEHPAREFGAAVAWQRDGEWPPRLLDGNHRACGSYRAARDGEDVSLTVHLGVGP
jgi:hypothetical protein